jgi:hypothetical protein
MSSMKFWLFVISYVDFSLSRSGRSIQIRNAASSYRKGYVKHHGPILLGKGFGPKAYQELHAIWSDISQKTIDSYTEGQISGVKALISYMYSSTETKVYEGCLSGAMACKFQMLLPLFAKNGDPSLSVLHQTFVPDGRKVPSSVDISISDVQQGFPCVLTALEIKWKSGNEFPEAQGCAVASSFWKASAIRQPWMPLFILSRNDYRIGVAFRAVGDRWAFSEIVQCLKEGPFECSNDYDVIRLLHFSQFFFQSAMYSLSIAVEPEQCNWLVDRNGERLLDNLQVIGERVLLGDSPTSLINPSENGQQKVVKFFANRLNASNAIERQKTIAQCLNYTVNPKLIEGCGAVQGADGMCAVVDNYIEETEFLICNHFISLTEQIYALYKHGLVHGDLRLLNVLFLKDGTVNLIDFEWSGKFGEARFPKEVNIGAFGNNSQWSISPGALIPREFDWYCLADLMDAIGCPKASIAARLHRKDDVLLAIRDLQLQAGTDRLALWKETRITSLNFCRLGERLRYYYFKETGVSASGKKVRGKRKRHRQS